MDDIEYNRQMEYDMMMNELLSMGENIDEYQKTNTEIIENAEEITVSKNKILKYHCNYKKLEQASDEY